LAVLVHVGGLWITSPPDVVDACFFARRRRFPYRAVAMWALFLAALVAAMRRRWHLAPRVWSWTHTGLVVAAVVGTVGHALSIDFGESLDLHVSAGGFPFVVLFEEYRAGERAVEEGAPPLTPMARANASTRRGDTPPIQASWMTATGAVSEVLRGSGKPGA